MIDRAYLDKMQLVRNGVGIDVDYDGSEKLGGEAITVLCYAMLSIRAFA